MMLLKNAKDINGLMNAIDKCRGDVILRHVNGLEEFNLKSVLSKYIALGKLCDEHGDQYEVYCMNRADETYLLEFFFNLYDIERR